MELILLEKIQNLGDLGDLVKVKAGYGRNYLVPQGKAVPATAAAKDEVDKRRRELAKLDTQRHDAAQAKAALLPDKVSVTRRAGEAGRLFGSVSAVDIVELLQAAELAVQRAEIDMPMGPIKELGEHQINIILHPEIQRPLTVVVVPEEVPENAPSEAAEGLSAIAPQPVTESGG